jgi:ATP-dependent helicase/nuclease subunit A
MAIKWTAEQQQTFAYDEERDLLISAAAGSGKTTVLTERIVRRLISGRIEPDRIAVMTFTDLAATQMAQKIETAIRSYQENETDTKTKLRARELVRQLPAMQISTIHSFCHSVIANYLSELVDEDGVPLIEPGYQVLKEEEKKLLVDQAIDDVLGAIYRLAAGGEAALSIPPTALLPRELPQPRSEIQPFVVAGPDLTLAAWLADFDLLAAAIAPGYDDQGLRDNLARMLNQLRSMADYPQWVQTELTKNYHNCRNWADSDYARDLFAALRSHLKPALEDLRQLQTLPYWDRIFDPREKAKTITALRPAMQAITVLLPALAEVLAAEDWDAINRLGRNLPPITVLKGGRGEQAQEFNALFNTHIAQVLALITSNFQNTRGNPVDRYFDDVYPWFSLSQAEIENSLGSTFGPLARLFELILLADSRYRTLKLRRNKVDFNDFEHDALRLLRQPQICAEYRRRYLEVYVDEYQDTSSIQEAVITSFARDNLYLVGDIKQSIYRFRYANPDLFRGKQERFTPYEAETKALSDSPEGYVIRLNRNFRSLPGIIAFVNQVFSSFLTRETGEIEYDRSEALIAGRSDEPDSDLPVEFLLTICDDETTETSEAENTETAADDEIAGASRADETNPVVSVRTSVSQTGDISNGVETELGLTPAPRSQEAAALLAVAQIRELLCTTSYKLSDIAILAPQHKTLDIWRQVLTSHSIPVAGIPKREFLDSPVLRQLEALVQVLDNSRQDIPLTSILLSGLLGESLSEEELLQIAASAEAMTVVPPTCEPGQPSKAFNTEVDSGRGISAGKVTAESQEPVSLQDDDESARTVYYRDPYYLRLEAFVAAGSFDREQTATFAVANGADRDQTTTFAAAESPDRDQTTKLRSKVRRLLNKLANWRQLSEDLPVSGLLTRIIADSGYADYLEHRSYAGENLADLESFLDWVKLLEQNQPLSINTLAGYIRNLREKDSQPEEIEPVVSVGDAVRVLTVHGSKGLEFPVVFLAGLDSAYHQRDRYQFASLSEQVGITSYSIDPQGAGTYLNLPHQVQLEAENMAEKAEKWRLLYVAMTRARDRLYLVDALDKPYGEISSNQKDLETAIALARAGDGRLQAETLRKIRHNRELIFHLLYLQDEELGAKVLAGTEGSFRFPHLQVRLIPRNKLVQQVYQETVRNLTDLIPPPLPDLTAVPDSAVPTPTADEAARLTKLLSDDVSGGILATAPAKITVSELKRQITALADAERAAEGLSSEVTLFSDMAFRLQQPTPKSTPQFADTKAPLNVSRPTESHTADNRRQAQMSATQLGVALHTVFQFLDFARLNLAEDAQREYEYQLEQMVAKQRLLPEEKAEVQGFADNALQFARSASGQRLLRADRIYREQPFTLAIPALLPLSTLPSADQALSGQSIAVPGQTGPDLLRIDKFAQQVTATADTARQTTSYSSSFRLAVPEPGTPITLLQGMIDLWLADAEGILLLDFKSDRVSADPAEAARVIRERYRIQIEVYAEAIRRATGQTVIDKKVWLIRPGIEVTF